MILQFFFIILMQLAFHRIIFFIWKIGPSVLCLLQQPAASSQLCVVAQFLRYFKLFRMPRRFARQSTIAKHKRHDRARIPAFACCRTFTIAGEHVLRGFVLQLSIKTSSVTDRFLRDFFLTPNTIRTLLELSTI